ncbi:tumor necrosis factor receptor superfamily member 4 isoform X2 [Paralichthys olivaceus]|uniref:tumor necrosis factor receptor superfamily member 4 isoform X2 n=1 Tax=Paralichthys olivaceus TaxID=8255 RepID=UPI003752BF97
MVLIKLLIFTLTFYQHIVDLDACPKGHKVKKGGKSGACEVCPDGYYQPEENNSLECKPCTRCQGNQGSQVKQKCDKETDTKCECRGDFVPWDSDSSTCKCNKGFGLTNGECEKCKDGYFSSKLNTPCKKWRECKSGEKTSGSSTTDVTCNEWRSNSTSHITHSPPQRPHEGTSTQNMHITATITTTAPPGEKVSPQPKGKMEPSPNSNSGNHIGMVLIILGIVGLLLLTVVTCKLHNAPCARRKPVLQNDSLCRRPVEESGDSSLSSLKMNPQEP